MLDSVPVVIVFDIDGTIIGDIRPQVMMYDLHMSLKNKDKKLNIIQAKDFRENLAIGGIIRPYFIKFVKTIKEEIPNVEYFIYTASERKWATYLVPHIEHACNCKFNRPILSRDNCVTSNTEYRKKVDVIYNCVIRSLRRKYKSIGIKEFENKVLIIDNNTVYNSRDMKHVLLCPTYDYIKPVNVPMFINERTYNAYAPIILSILGRYMTMPEISSSPDYNEFQKYFYTNFIDELTKINRHNVKEQKDKFFLYLMHIIVYKRIKSFSPATISYMSKKITSKMT